MMYSNYIQVICDAGDILGRFHVLSSVSHSILFAYL